MNLKHVYDAQEALRLHLCDIQEDFEADVEIESNEVDYWPIVDFVAKTTFTFMGQLKNGDDAQRLKTIARAEYIMMRLNKSDLIDEFDNATQEQGWEIYCLIRNFKIFLEAIIELDI